MKAALLIACAVLIAVASARPKWHQLQGYSFEQYQKDFGKNYASHELELRRKTFEKNLNEIQAHNADLSKTWRMGVNHLTDRTQSEKKMMNGARPRQMGQFADAKLQEPYVAPKLDALPTSVDWRTKYPSILTAVKDQGMCGSCWAHGATEQLETFWALRTGNLFVLSQQQVTACAPNPDQCGGTGGCQGSIAELAFEYVVKSGLTQEWEYPYTAYNGNTGSCLASRSNSVINMTGYVKLPGNNQQDVLNALATIGPLAVNVDASGWSSYEEGVFAGCDYKNNITIDHVVQLVGYGHDNTLNVDYWIVRNSWSPAYGEHGYIRVLRTPTAACGWDVDPQEGTACKGSPPQLWVCGMCGIVFDTSYPVAGSS